MSSDQNQTSPSESRAWLQKRAIRRRFLESVASVLVILGLIALPVSLARVPKTGFHPNHLVHIILGASIIILFFIRKRISDRILTISILFIFSALSVSAFMQYGLASAGFYFGASAIFVTAVAFGVRAGMICTGLYGLFIAAVAYLWISGHLVFPGNAGQYLLLPSVWATLGVAFLITTAVLFLSAAELYSGLNSLIDTIDEQKCRIEEHTAELTRTNQELETAMRDIKTLSGLLPICANCKNIRDDKGYWQKVENYLSHHSQATFTHCLCPDCMRKLYPEIAEQVLSRVTEKDESK